MIFPPPTFHVYPHFVILISVFTVIISCDSFSFNRDFCISEFYYILRFIKFNIQLFNSFHEKIMIRIWQTIQIHRFCILCYHFSDKICQITPGISFIYNYRRVSIYFFNLKILKASAPKIYINFLPILAIFLFFWLLSAYSY